MNSVVPMHFWLCYIFCSSWVLFHAYFALYLLRFICLFLHLKCYLLVSNGVAAVRLKLWSCCFPQFTGDTNWFLAQNRVVYVYVIFVTGYVILGFEALSKNLNDKKRLRSQLYGGVLFNVFLHNAQDQETCSLMPRVPFSRVAVSSDVFFFLKDLVPRPMFVFRSSFFSLMCF